MMAIVLRFGVMRPPATFGPVEPFFFVTHFRVPSQHVTLHVVSEMSPHNLVHPNTIHNTVHTYTYIYYNRKRSNLQPTLNQRATTATFNEPGRSPATSLLADPNLGSNIDSPGNGQIMTALV
jgi:hypothetical protein